MGDQIRWLMRRDMGQVLAIEKRCFECAWDEEDFLCCLRQRNCIGMVAERSGLIIGFMVYELHGKRLHLKNFAVDPIHRRTDIGTQMVRRLIDRITQQGRREITLEVRETNLAAQLFFKAMGFKALGVLRDRYDDTTEDAYLMRYLLGGESTAFSPRPGTSPRPVGRNGLRPKGRSPPTPETAKPSRDGCSKPRWPFEGLRERDRADHRSDVHRGVFGHAIHLTRSQWR